MTSLENRAWIEFRVEKFINDDDRAAALVIEMEVTTPGNLPIETVVEEIMSMATNYARSWIRENGRVSVWTTKQH